MKPQTSIEKVNIDKALEVFDNNQFYLILAASVRAREIANQRNMNDKNGIKQSEDTKPTVAALQEIATGKVGKEYLTKIRQ